jgi:hypothetical protein
MRGRAARAHPSSREDVRSHTAWSPRGDIPVRTGSVAQRAAPRRRPRMRADAAVPVAGRKPRSRARAALADSRLRAERRLGLVAS